MIDGVEVAVSPEAVVVTADRPLTVISSAVAGGGIACARAIVNLHVGKNGPWQDPTLTVGAFVRRRSIPEPFVGLLTAAWTEKAETAVEHAFGMTAMVVATVGLSNPVAAGTSARPTAMPSTINTIVIVDADTVPAALVNLVVTVTEVKTAVLGAAGLRCPGGQLASGTSTDAVAVAVTGRGEPLLFGGPASELGWTVARAARRALEAGVRRWMDEHP